MKKLVLLFSVVISTLIISSCSKKDDTSPILEGKWLYSKEGVFENSVESLNNYVHEANCNKDYMQLNGNGTMIDGFYNSEITPCAESKTSGTYTLKDNKLSLNNDGGTRNFEVILFTDNELKIRASNGTTILFVRN